MMVCHKCLAFLCMLMLPCLTITTASAADRIGSDTLQSNSGTTHGKFTEKVSSTDCQDSHEFLVRQLIPGATLVAIGAAGIPATRLRQDINDRITLWNIGQTSEFEDIIQYTPSLAYLVAGSLGVPAKHDFTDRFILFSSATVIEYATVKTIKFSVGESRPNGTDNKSFPSGHTATAFAGAELSRLEYGWGVGIPAYAVASFSGLMRVCHNKHWLNDVLAGAGMGILSANATYWLYPFEKRFIQSVFHTDRKTRIAVLPAYNPDLTAPLLSLTASF